MNFEILEIFNESIDLRKKPDAQWGVTSFPDSFYKYKWTCLSVKRLSDGEIFYKGFTETNKGKVLFFRITHTAYATNPTKRCYINTVLGEFEIESVQIIK